MRFGLAWMAGILFAASAFADSNGDALQWLQRVALVSDRLSYSGIFVYQCGSRTESSRITHVADDKADMEHIEMLDGSPREVVRIGDEVRTWLPETRRVVIERRMGRLGFPAMPTELADLTDYYVVRRGVPDRVAGFDAQPIRIEPRDSYRYARELWVDRKSGLLLKTETFDENGEPRESATFIEVRIGGNEDREAIKTRFNHVPSNWRVQEVQAQPAHSGDGVWRFNAVLPGFRQMTSVLRQIRADLPEGSQLVFSDGLAAISVFIDPLPADQPPPIQGQFIMGALNVYKRVIGKYLIVLVGDVPMAALKKFGDGVARKS